MKNSLQKEVPQRLIYQPRLQNRRLRVQVLVPLPKTSDTLWCRRFLHSQGLEDHKCNSPGDCCLPGRAPATPYNLPAANCNESRRRAFIQDNTGKHGSPLQKTMQDCSNGRQTALHLIRQKSKIFDTFPSRGRLGADVVIGPYDRCDKLEFSQ